MKLDRFDGGAVAVLLLTFALVAAAPFGPKALGDLDFHREARTMALAIKGATPWSKVQITRAPGPVLFFVPPYLTVPAGGADRSYWRAGVVWTSAWMVIALLLIRRTAARLGGERAGRIAAILTLLSPFSVYYSFGISAEGPAYLSVAVFLFGWAHCAGPVRGRGALTLMAVGLISLVLCRPNAALIFLFGLLAAWRLWRYDPRAARLAAGVSVLTVAVFMGAGLALSLLQGSAARSGQSDYFWHVALPGRFQFRTEPFDWRFWDSITRQGSRDFADYQAESLRIAREADARGVPVMVPTREFIIADTLAHPFVTAKMALVRVLALHLNFVNSKSPAAFAVWVLPGSLVYWTFHLIVNLIGVSISLLALRFIWMSRARLAEYWPLWAPWVALILFHCLVYSEPRYLLPTRSCQAVMAACALAARFPGKGAARAAAVECA